MVCNGAIGSAHIDRPFRLESKKPKRALFFRFDRLSLEHFEYLDITPTPTSQNARQDCPGGFDYDGHSFWIPVAESRPQSLTTAVKVIAELDQPLSEASQETAFVVDDHIGALAVDRQPDRLYGANWDTKEIYVYERDGKRLSLIPRGELVQDQTDWALAVQDWKSLSEGMVLVGGVDKNPRRDPLQPRALLQWLNIKERRLIDSIRLPSPTADESTPTHEGMAVFQDELFLLPDDLGNDALLHRYKLEATR